MTAFRPLPPVGTLLADDPLWRYPSRCGAGEGVARLRLYATADGVLAIVTELGLGATVTNSTECIWATLDHHLRGDRLILLEHWPAGESGDEHLNQATITGQGQRPSYRRIWPTPPINPNHNAFEQWMRRYGHRALAAAMLPPPQHPRKKDDTDE